MRIECERGEDDAKATYIKALEANLPLNIREIVIKQFKEIRQDYALIPDLKSKYARKD